MSTILTLSDRFLPHPKYSDTTGWKERHLNALRYPRKFERPIVAMCQALEEYAFCHLTKYGSPIGDDGVLGKEWEHMARAVIGLLNGDCGRLDCGTVDAAIRDLGKAAGVNLDD